MELNIFNLISLHSRSKYWSSNNGNKGLFINVLIICYHPVICPLLNCSMQKVYSSERTLSNVLIWNPQAKKYIFLFKKKRKTKKEWFQLCLEDTRNLSLLQHQYDQGGLNKKKMQLNACKIFSILIFNEFHLFA